MKGFSFCCKFLPILLMLILACSEPLQMNSDEGSEYRVKISIPIMVEIGGEMKLVGIFESKEKMPGVCISQHSHNFKFNETFGNWPDYMVVGGMEFTKANAWEFSFKRDPLITQYASVKDLKIRMGAWEIIDASPPGEITNSPHEAVYELKGPIGTEEITIWAIPRWPESHLDIHEHEYHRDLIVSVRVGIGPKIVTASNGVTTMPATMQGARRLHDLLSFYDEYNNTIVAPIDEGLKTIEDITNKALELRDYIRQNLSDSVVRFKGFSLLRWPNPPPLTNYRDIREKAFSYANYAIVYLPNLSKYLDGNRTYAVRRFENATLRFLRLLVERSSVDVEALVEADSTLAELKEEYSREEKGIKAKVEELVGKVKEIKENIKRYKGEIKKFPPVWYQWIFSGKWYVMGPAVLMAILILLAWGLERLLFSIGLL